MEGRQILREGWDERLAEFLEREMIPNYEANKKLERYRKEVKELRRENEELAQAVWRYERREQREKRARPEPEEDEDDSSSSSSSSSLEDDQQDNPIVASWEKRWLNEASKQQKKKE